MDKKSFSPSGKTKSHSFRKTTDLPANEPGQALASKFTLKNAVSDRCPIVGVGASAGGLEAFSSLLKSLPGKTGMAIVFVQHLDPKRESQLAPILSRVTTMPVHEVTDGIKLDANHVYIIPPNANMVISGEVLRLLPRNEGRGFHMPVDHFFCSLAEVQKNKAIGVVLSGMASDGTIGLKAIKAGGGITFAEDENHAKYTGMPHSAVAAECVDFILPPEGIAKELARIARHPYLRTSPEQAGPENSKDGVKKIFLMLRKTTGVDFNHYRKSTINRRIQRRMLLHKLEDVDAFAEHLKKDPEEIKALYQDILIHVTGFFREPESFTALKDEVFPKLMRKRYSPDEAIRVWLPGCSTGEEAYSVAISLVEFLGEMGAETRIQIFATDVSEQMIEKGRRGIFMENIEKEVSPERLRRFFTKVNRGWQISKSIREMCVFARQNVIKDPPFSKLDIISCRNLLIYLETEVQKKLMPVFHYALNPDGFLVLGSAETVGTFDEIFRIVDQKNKIYQKKAVILRPAFNVGSFDYDRVKDESRQKTLDTAPKAWTRLDVLKEAERLLVSKYCPPAIIVDENLEIIQFRGQVSPFIEPATGEASLSLYKMTREGFQVELRAIIQKAKHSDSPVRKEGIKIKTNGHSKTVNLEVIGIGTTALQGRCFMILFEEGTPPSEPPARAKAGKENPQVAHMEEELAAIKLHLQAVVEEQDATNEELRSANEEIQSSNEELQSTNEELETAKEELQSANEELTTVNEEMRHTNLELAEANDDLGNLLRGVNLPIVMVDRELRIRRFTPTARKTLKLLPTDVGRTIGDLRPDIGVPDLERLLHEVIDSLGMKEIEVQDRAGHWYLLQIRPYETGDNKIAGAVIVLFDIDANKLSRERVRHAAEYAEAIVQTVRDPLLILNGELRVKTATQGFYKMFRVTPEVTEGKLFYELGNGQWNVPGLRNLMENLLPQNTHVKDYMIEHIFPHIGRKRMLFNAHRVERGPMDEPLVLLSIEEVKD